MEEKLEITCVAGCDGCNFCHRAGLYPGVNDILFKFVTYLFY